MHHAFTEQVHNIHTTHANSVTALEKTSQYTDVTWIIPPRVCCTILNSFILSVATHCSHLKIKYHYIVHILVIIYSRKKIKNFVFWLQVKVTTSQLFTLPSVSRGPKYKALHNKAFYMHHKSCLNIR